MIDRITTNTGGVSSIHPGRTVNHQAKLHTDMVASRTDGMPRTWQSGPFGIIPTHPRSAE